MSKLGSLIQLHIGMKLVYAIAMTRGEYNVYRGWEQPVDEDPADKGFLIEYVDGGKPNHPNHSGYISWSPEHVFKPAYHSSGNWRFGEALEMLRRGYKVQRKGWNGKGMWLVMVKGTTHVWPKEGTPYHTAGLKEVDIDPHLDLYTAKGSMQPGWNPSQADLFAEDWQLAE